MTQIKQISTGENNMSASINSDIWAALAETEDALTLAEEQLHEVKSEAAGECHAFGDASVGSFERTVRQEIEVQYFRNIYNHLLGQFNSIYSN